MARLLLKQPHKGHNAGEIIEVLPERAAQLVLEKVGVLAPPKPPSTTVDKLQEMLLQFRVALDSLVISEEEQAEAKTLLQKAIIPILPAFMPTTPELNDSDVAPTALDIAGALPTISEHVRRVIADAETPDEDKEKLQAAIDTFASEFMTKIEMQGADASEVPNLADPVGSVEEIPKDGKLSADNVSQETKPVSRMNHEELVAHATKLGIEVPADATNADIKKLIAEKTAQ